MTHDAAVRIVVGLAPEIEKKGAEAALTGYARAEDLAPALLEKIAQVFNTLSTVSHVKNATDRGSTAYLVDVPELVALYATTEEPVKRATSGMPRTSHDVSQVNLLAAMRTAVTPPEPQRTVEKAAAAEEPIPDDVLRAVAFDMACDAMLDAEKAAGELRVLVDDGVSFDFTLAELDALCDRRPEAVKAAFDWASAGLRRTVIRADYEKSATARNFDADTAIGRVAKRLVDAVAMRDTMRKVAAGIETIFDQHDAGQPLAAGSNDKPVGEADTDKANEAAAAAAALGEAAAATDGEATTATGGGAGDGGGGRDQPKDRSQGSDRSTKSKSDSPTKDSGGKASGGTAALLSNLAVSPFSAAADAVISAAGKADSMLSGITGKDRMNSAQRRTDISVEDIRRSLNIRRMIGTDPVLRESDPRDVLEMYNAIARTNPDIAGNMQQMRLLLREALSYDGLTLDSQKQLADIRKSTVDAEGKAADNDRRRYSVGGSDLPQLTSLPARAK